MAVNLISTKICISHPLCVPNVFLFFFLLACFNNPFFHLLNAVFVWTEKSQIKLIITVKKKLKFFIYDLRRSHLLLWARNRSEKQMRKLRSTALNKYQHLITHQHFFSFSLVFLSSRAVVCSRHNALIDRYSQWMRDVFNRQWLARD